MGGGWLFERKEKKEEAGCWLRTAVALDIIPRNVDVIPRVNRDPDPIPLKVGIDDVDIVVPDLVKRLAPIFQSKLGSKSQEFASFESESSDLVHGGGGGEPQPDVCAAQSIDDTGVLVSLRARKDTHNHQQENSEQIPMETLSS